MSADPRSGAQLRYSFGSLLIDAGEPLSRVSRMMGHVNESITGSIYAHEIERRDSGERTRASMRVAFGSGTNVERTREHERVTAPAGEPAEVAQLRG